MRLRILAGKRSRSRKHGRPSRSRAGVSLQSSRDLCLCADASPVARLLPPLERGVVLKRSRHAR